MKFRILPVARMAGAVNLPASKSYSIRAVFIAACGGSSRLSGLSDCDDAKAALTAARALGASFKAVPGGFMVTAASTVKNKKKLGIDVRESGTSLRFILPLLPFYTDSALINGRGTLIGRPNRHLLETLVRCGLKFYAKDSNGSVPITFDGGNFSGGRVSIDASLSSQFVSALMIALPRAPRDTRLLMTGRKLVSQDYVTMTASILERAGVIFKKVSAREFFIPGGQQFRGLKSFTVPSDYGLAAFLLAAAALTTSNVTLKGYFDDSLVQSDGAILGFLEKMGVSVQRGRRMLRIKGPCCIKGGTFSLANAPDLVPVMAVMAMFAQGETRLTDIAHARVKESDRISDLRSELLKTGADITETKDELRIRPRAQYKSNVELDPHRDHRLAMAFTVLGAKIGVTVRDMECCAKSYPAFVRHFRSLAGAGRASLC